MQNVNKAFLRKTQSVAFCTFYTNEMDLQTKDIPFGWQGLPPKEFTNALMVLMTAIT